MQLLTSGESRGTPYLLGGAVAKFSSRWYFDAVSTSSANETIVIVFYETPPGTFVNTASTVLSGELISAYLSKNFL